MMHSPLFAIYQLTSFSVEFTWFWRKKIFDKLSNLQSVVVGEFCSSSKHFAGIEKSSKQMAQSQAQSSRALKFSNVHFRPSHFKAEKFNII